MHAAIDRQQMHLPYVTYIFTPYEGSLINGSREIEEIADVLITAYHAGRRDIGMARSISHLRQRPATGYGACYEG